MPNLSERSEANLAKVHPKLALVVRAAFMRMGEFGGLSFIVTEGARSIERQKQLVVAGASRTMNSRHLVDESGYCHAVDLAATIDGKVAWDWPLYGKIAFTMKEAAKDLGVPLIWGGDWKNFKDGPHFEIPPGTPL